MGFSSENNDLSTCTLLDVPFIPMVLVSGGGIADVEICVARSVLARLTALYMGVVEGMLWGDSGSGNWQLVFVVRLETCSRRLGTHRRLWSATARAVPF